MSVPVVGIDLGNESCFVAVARAGGIETVDNDYSLRATPTCVAFGDRKRILGVAAKNQAVTNIKNTLFGFKRLLGRSFDDPGVLEVVNRAPFKLIRMKDGGIGIEVTYLDEKRVFSPEQVTAMLLTKLKETAETAIQAKVQECVISVPSYFTDAERRALLDASQIAGLKVLRLLNETAAVALCYGIYKQDLPELQDKPRNVIIVDCGHSAIQVCAVAFNKEKLQVIACTADPYLGGRNFDAAIAAHFCTEFRTKYGIDPESNPKAYLRLLTEVEKLKKQMSANATKLPLNIECFMEEKDVSSSMCRADFEKMCESLFQRVEVVLQKCLIDSKLDINDIYAVEIVGGSTRIPAIKLLIEKIFKKTPSTTLNQDEAVSRGCALQCAILSPAFKVRDFSIGDVQPYPINLIYDETAGSTGELEVFPQYHPIPFVRMLTFTRKEALTLNAVYAGQVPFHIPNIGKYVIDFKVDDDEPRKVKVKARINIHGIFNISNANIYEKVEKSADQTANSEPMAEDQNSSKSNDPEAMNCSEPIDASNNADVVMEKSEAKTEEPKIVYVKAKELQIQSSTSGLSQTDLDAKIMDEIHMVSRDRTEQERLDSRNALEEYVYDLREKLDSDLSGFVEENERNKLSETLSYLENWLYEDGGDEKKEVYMKYYDDLKSRAEPIKERRIEFEVRPRAIKELEIVQQQARKVVDLYNAKDPKYDHVSKKDMDKAATAIKESEAWLENCRLQFGQNYQPYMSVPVKVADINSQRKALEDKVSAIINTPKPAPPAPKSEAQEEKMETQNQSKADSTPENAEPETMQVE